MRDEKDDDDDDNYFTVYIYCIHIYIYIYYWFQSPGNMRPQPRTMCGDLQLDSKPKQAECRELAMPHPAEAGDYVSCKEP